MVSTAAPDPVPVRWLLVLLVLTTSGLVSGQLQQTGQVLNPPYFNLAEGRRITASATCGQGVTEPELYCKLVGAHADQKDNPNVNLIQGQVCDFCDPSNPDLNHPPEYAIDGSEKWWQSPPLSRGTKYNEVNLTIDLGQEFHVAYVFIKMANSPRPEIWVLERSQDLGKTWEPWQYFADTPSDCVNFFGQSSLERITRDDSVICETRFSKVVPLEGGEVVVSLLNDRPSANNFYNSTLLQEWTKATNIRLRLLRTKTLLGHLMSVARQDPTVTRRYFYSVRDINVGGRCVCNGHAGLCDITDPNDVYKLLCRCQHNTCGSQCERCCPGYVQKKWQRATPHSLNECEPCNCFGHSDECVYDEQVDEKRTSLDTHGNYEGGGVCQNCRHHTEGINCNRCQAGYYRPYGKLHNATDVCQPCVCDLQFSTGSCEDETGQCLCRPEFLPPYCSDCNVGYFGYPSCRPCDCHVDGTRGTVCEVGGGQCPCKPSYTGTNCDRCARDYYGFPNCSSCSCNPTGSLGNSCDPENGQCVCKNNFGGRTCGECDDGFYDYPNCKYCNCDSTGSEPSVCDKNTGLCICREGYGGPRCDQCAPGYFGYPECRKCECNQFGSVNNICDETGKCSCSHNFASHLCDQCSPGYYRYPECISCDCDTAGAIGLSCDDDGRCQCKPNFGSTTCNVCKQGYYNYPECEECNCNPAGVASTFAGCDSQAPGELCNCKERVTGRICNHCKPLFWNLQASNAQGCEDCHCHLPGTIGGISVCDEVTGQCLCKGNVGSRQCRECRDGSFDLQEGNVFGCADCGCDIGGAVSNTCDKRSGQCICRPRVSGLKCNDALQLHYFPTLFHNQYEAEDGRTPSNTPVRFGYDELDFPGYSWRGYAVFSQIQKEVLLDVHVDKPSLYRVVYRYANLGSEPINGFAVFTPESSSDTQQFGNMRFEATETPKFGMATAQELVAGITPASFVLNPGRWTLTLKGEKPLLLDYVVLLPAAYYEATILQEHIQNPCTIGQSTGKCQHFKCPDIAEYPTVKGDSAYTADGDQRQRVETYTNEQVLLELGVGPMAIIDEDQKQMFVELSVPKPGRYVLVLLYHTPDGGKTSTVMLDAVTAGGRDKGRVTLNDCRLAGLCRQVVTDARGKVSIFNFDSNKVTLDIKGSGEGMFILESVVAIPARQWNMDFVRLSPSCIKKDGQCLEGHFHIIPGSIKVEAETANEDQKATELPVELFDDNIGLVYLDHKDAVVDIRGRVPHAGGYVFIVHYYQPKHPEFDLDVLIQNGQFYEAVLPVPFCPSVSGCRSVIKSKDGVNFFQILENFMVTLREPNHKSVWIDYILAIPIETYREEVLQQLPLDRTVDFIRECGQEQFYISSKEEGFCRNATFSLTSEYNNGGLPCECDFYGSFSFECNKFGGQCPCKDNIIGRRCRECRTGYYGFPDCKPCNCPSTAVCHPGTGECICPPRVTGEKCDQCLSNTYGYDPIIGCEECNCNPLGVKRGNLQCDLSTGECDCKPNVVSRTCDRCQAGYYSFPSCRLCQCDLRGATADICDRETSQCFCKENVYGQLCDQCKPGTFNLEEKNPNGCTKCFCFGKTEQCSSTSMFRSQIQEQQGWRAAALILNPFGIEEHEVTDEIELDVDHLLVNLPFSTSPDVIYFFSAPKIFLGNKITSYGGKLQYNLEYTKRQSGLGSPVLAADVILVGSNFTIAYEHTEQVVENIPLTVTVDIREWNFRHWTGAVVTREQLMTLLVSLDKIYIRAYYNTESNEARLRQVSLDLAVTNFLSNSLQATGAEQCHCPPNYQGSSCETCASGYYRAPTGPYGGYCIPCQCHGHADSCDPLSGICHNCKHNTFGDHCDKCNEGFHGDATIGSPNDCLICACPLPMTSNNFATSCELSPSGLKIRCECKPGYIGARCDYCSAGFYGRPEVIGDTCKSCQCSGNIDLDSIESCDSVTGQCLRCLNNTFGSACELCAPGFYGDAVSTKNCRKCFCDECGARQCHHGSGKCQCHPNVVGEKCTECAHGFWGFDSCEGCISCNCSLASESPQCDINTGQCKCRPGVTGRTCDRCLPGHWSYGPHGCHACRCNEDYSIGGTCNAHSGRCECLPGVVGDKCDRCPYRWVLIDNVGCQECGPCVHTLLDDLDALHGLYDPIWEDLKGVAFSFFAYQKLSNVNKTVDELRPLVNALISDPTSVDLRPLEVSVDELEKLSKQVEERGVRTKEQANATSVDADATSKEALRVEKLIKDTIKDVQGVVAGIQSLASGFSEWRGPNRDRMLAEAEKMLAEILARDFIPPKSAADDELQAAKEILERAKAFALPAQRNRERVDKLDKAVDDLRDKLHDLLNNSAAANAASFEAEQLNKKNKNPSAAEKVRKIANTKEAIDKLLAEGQDLLDKARALLNEAKDNFSDLDLEDERLKQLMDRLRDFVDDLKNGLKNVALDVRKAEGHAKKLMDQAAELDGLLADTRESAEGALKAAKSYGNIVDAINEAKKAAEVAVQAANNATDESDGLDIKAEDSLRRSKELMEDALQTRGRVEGDLKDRLAAAKAGVDAVGKTNQGNRFAIDELNRAMDRLPSKTLGPDAQKAKDLSIKANGKAEMALEKVNAIADKLPEDKARADQIPRDIDEANKAIKRANGQVEKAVGLIPDLKHLMDRLGLKASAIKVVGVDVGEKVAELRRKIALARDQANRINVGIRFYHNTTLQLRNPDGLHRSATSTKLSMFFKTEERDGFLGYLGSPVGTKQRMKRALTDDFMALEVLNGNVALTMDIGSGHKKIINDKFVADNQWHEVIVDRIGRTVTLTVRTDSEDDSTVEDNLPGTFSVFNLDQDLSKFYVGGFPQDAHIQPEVSRQSLNGAIEEVMFDDKPVGLWNFADGVNNKEGYLERDSLIILKENNGVQLDGSGYVILQKRRQDKFQKNVEVIMRFKTFADNGLLFLIGKNSKYLSLEMLNGKVVYQFELGSGRLIITTDESYNDGKWHTIEATRSGRDGLLKVDGKDSGVKRSSGREEQLEFTDSIYIGGHPKNHNFEQVTNSDFEGCIDNLQIGATLINLNNNKEALGAVPGCPVKISRSVTFLSDSKGHIGMPVMELGDDPQLTFRFKTLEPNGILFYAANRDQTNYLSLSLAEGLLVLRARPGGDVQSGQSVQYNDGEWHYLSATKNQSHLQLVIDDYEVFDKRATAIGEIDSSTPLYFGGVPKGYVLATGAAPTDAFFVGCIGDATINGKFQNFADTRDRAGANLISCPLADPETSTPPLVAVGTNFTLTEVTLPPRQRATPRPPTTTSTTRTTSTTAPFITTTTTTTTTARPQERGQCKLPLRPRGDPDLSELNGLRFGNTYHSREERLINPPSLRTSSELSLEFKTSNSDGVLFFLADSGIQDLFGAYLKDGKVNYVFNLGTGKAELVSSKSYNDNQWHTVVFSRRNLQGELIIDAQERVQGASVGTAATMNVLSPLYLGGVPQQHAKGAKTHFKNVDVSFNGCIRNLRFVNQTIRTLKQEDVSPCSEMVEAGAFFSADGGHLVVLDAFRVGITKNIQLKLKARNTDGVLLAVHSTRMDFLILQLVNGSVKFSVDNGAGIITTEFHPPSPSYLCDGQWHTIKAMKTKNLVTLNVDGIFVNPGIGVAGVSATDTNNPLHVGGIPDMNARGLETKEQFVGCIKNLEIENKSHSLTKARVVGSVTASTCPTN